MNGFNIKLSTAEERIINGGQTRRTCLERSTKSQRDVKYKKKIKRHGRQIENVNMPLTRLSEGKKSENQSILEEIIA